MTDKRQKLGAWGEQVAADFLQQEGYDIIERNYRCRLGELDIIALFEDQLIFCEVKTRKKLGDIDPSASVTSAKMKKIRQLAELYLIQHNHDHLQPRFDVITVCLQDGKIVEHFINAF